MNYKVRNYYLPIRAKLRKERIIKNIPNKPGMYLFYNSDRELIYVGKAINLKARISSYFSSQSSVHSSLWRPIEEMIHEVKDIKWKITDSAMEAILLEGMCIKKNQPKYNIRWRDDKSWNYLVITRDIYPRFLPMRAHELDKMDKKEFKHIFGPYPELNTKATLTLLRRIFNWSNCKPPNIKIKPCFYYHLGQCPGICTGEMRPKEYRLKVINPLIMFLRGGKKQLIKNLEKSMIGAAKAENFEEARRLRDQIRSLKHIHDTALLNESFVRDIFSNQGGNDNLRIEGYDISNLGAIGKAGSMVVFNKSGPRKSEYKRFMIRKVIGQSDVDCLAEVLERRFNHPEWPYPDLILVDGGKPQVNRALRVLGEVKLKIPLVGLAKGAGRKKNEIILGVRKSVWIKWIYAHLKLLISIRDEAHRFARSYYRYMHRKKIKL